ncbi:Serine/threonine-protein phosphatase 7 long form [Glycine max]|nr:Serine/threonine-protein phosphatase 7 long form [Glycine max]
MASSSSSSSHVNIKSGPIDADVLWMQPKHVSEHVWNGEEDRKLHIRRAVPTYQGEEQIPEQIFPFLLQSGFAWIIKMGYLKINASLISALIERWRPETHTFHMRCGECTITLQDVSVLLGISVDDLPLIGPTNLDWANLCEELLGVRPQEDEIRGSVVKLSWLAHHFAQINNDDDEEQVRRWLRRGNQHIGNDDVRVFRRKLDIMKCHEFVWEPYPSTVISLLPPVCLVGSLAWYAVVPLICFQVIEWHQPDRVLRQFGMQQPIPESPSQPLNIHGITLKGKHDENWGQLFAPMIDQWNNRHAFRVDAYPRQEGLLSFNSDYMVWYRRKTKMFVDPANAKTTTLVEVAEALQYMVSPQGRNTCTFDDLVPYMEKITILSEEQERVTEPVSHGPASERQFPAQQFHMLQSSIETQGIDRRRDTVKAEEYSQQMAERGHGMYYTPQTFAEYPTQMYQYPFQGHHTNTSASQQSFGGVAETQAHFSWPTMTLSQQYHGPIPTPNAPLGTQWNVPGQIPNTGDLFGVDLRHAFSAEADEEEAGRHRGRRNPDRQARRWDRPCGTSSRHHRHQNE